MITCKASNKKRPSENFSDGLCVGLTKRIAAMHTLDLEQQRYDSMLPPDNSTTEEEVEDKVTELIKRHGLDWLCGKVDVETWARIVAALEAEALIEIRAEIEDAKWEWRNRFN
jgi:hypothetical protein